MRCIDEQIFTTDLVGSLIPKTSKLRFKTWNKFASIICTVLKALLFVNNFWSFNKLHGDGWVYREHRANLEFSKYIINCLNLKLESTHLKRSLISQEWITGEWHLGQNYCLAMTKEKISKQKQILMPVTANCTSDQSRTVKHFTCQLLGDHEWVWLPST